MQVRFQQILAMGEYGKSRLFGLSTDGLVYCYIPAREGDNKYALWSQLTAYTPNKDKPEHEPK